MVLCSHCGDSGIDRVYNVRCWHCEKGKAGQRVAAIKGLYVSEYRNSVLRAEMQITDDEHAEGLKAVEGCKV